MFFWYINNEEKFFYKGVAMNDDAMLIAIQEIVLPYGLKAELWPDTKRVCVRGDGRGYLPILNLIGPPPSHEILANLSGMITNKFEIGSVTFQLAQKDSKGI